MNMRFIFNRFDLSSLRFILWVLLWCVGIVAGILMAIYMKAIAIPLLQSAISNRASLISLVLISGITMLLTGIALNRSFAFLVCSLIFLTGISKGFAGMLAYLAFGSGAWVLRFMLHFTNITAMLLMWWLLSKHCKRKQQSLCRDYIFAAVFMCFVSALDAFVISPFITGLSI